MLVGLPMMVNGMFVAVAVALLDIVSVLVAVFTKVMLVVAGMPGPEMPCPAATFVVLDTVTEPEPMTVEPVTGSVPTRQLAEGDPMGILVGAGWT